MDTRKKILSVASQIFSRHGFYKTSMDEIARSAHKAKGSLYYYFGSKEELFTEVVKNEIEIMKKELAVIVTDPKPPANEKLRNYLHTRMEMLRKATNYHETLKSDFFDHFEFVDSLRNDLDHWEKEQFKFIIRQGIEAGIFADQTGKMDVLIDVLIMVLKGLEIPFFIQKKYDDLKPYFDDLIGIVVKGIAV